MFMTFFLTAISVITDIYHLFHRQFTCIAKIVVHDAFGVPASCQITGDKSTMFAAVLYYLSFAVTFYVVHFVSGDYHV